MTNEQIDVTSLAAELASIQEGKKLLTDREEAIKAQLRSLGEGSHGAGPLTVTVTPTRGLDAERVKETFPPEDFPAFYETKPSTTALRKSIAPDLYDALMMETGKPKISIKVNKD